MINILPRAVLGRGKNAYTAGVTFVFSPQFALPFSLDQHISFIIILLSVLRSFEKFLERRQKHSMYVLRLLSTSRPNCCRRVHACTALVRVRPMLLWRSELHWTVSKPAFPVIFGSHAINASSRSVARENPRISDECGFPPRR